MIYNHLHSDFMSQDGYVSMIREFIQADLSLFVELEEPSTKRTRVSRTGWNVNNPEELWRTPWGTMLQDPRLLDPHSWQAAKFRRRFRVPHSVFLLLVQKCKTAHVFGTSKIPEEFKLMIALRILGRASCADDMCELSWVGESTCNSIFHQFCHGFVDNYYDDYVTFPTGDVLKQVNSLYSKFGFDGACGSMDVTHVRLGKCPEGLKVLATGKENYPTLAFQCVCTPNRVVTYCSSAYMGSYNDITITANDQLCKDIQGGLLDDVEYTLVDDLGVPRTCHGGYIIVDGGYQKENWLMDPYPIGCSVEEKRYSEWLESVRKDIECTFGLIKMRFRLFLSQIQFHKFKDIEYAWKAAVMLHNLLITYDGNDLSEWERNLDWSSIDPDLQDGVFENAMLVNDYIDEVHAGHISKTDWALVQHMKRQTGAIVKSTTPTGRDFKAANSGEYWGRKTALVTNFNALFKIGLVKWPKRSDISLRYRMRIPKFDMTDIESVGYCLYVKKSDFLSTTSGMSIGSGLFSHLPYKEDNVIAQFVGRIIDREEFDAEEEAGKGGYCVRLPNKHVRDEEGVITHTYSGRVLQCYDTRQSGACVASVTNSAYKCTNVTTNRPAINNCKIKIHRDTIKLVCDRVYIMPHTELAWDYGNEYVYPS